MISEYERPASHVAIRTSGGAATVTVDGHELRTVVKATLALDGDGPPVLKLALLAASGLEVDGHAVVMLDKATRKALQAMGWTAPPERGDGDGS
jgi:hypothetical protein